MTRSRKSGWVKKCSISIMFSRRARRSRNCPIGCESKWISIRIC
eukprot:COSAG01_NODE_64907_length_275_cov_0.545455_1_plen_43_part_10